MKKFYAVLLTATLSSISTAAVSQQVTLVSSSATGVKGNGQSTRPDVSGDGRYVAFVSSSNNFGVGDGGGSDIFVKDTLTGTVSLASKASDGTPGNNTSSTPVTISADGRYVTFLSFATNLVPNDTNARYDLFWHDRSTGQTQMVNVAPDGTASNNYADFPAVSGDGRYVAFRSSATNLVSPAPSGNQVYLRDMIAGTTRLISRNASGAPQGGGEPDISSDGRWVSYVGSGSAVYLVDTLNCDATACNVRRVNVNNQGQAVPGHTSVLFPKISGNGRYVTWESNAPGFVPNDTNGTTDIFVHDALTSTTSRVSVASDGAEANNSSFTGDISDDGRYVSFTSNATNLAGPDTNGVADVYLHDRQDGQTIRLTVTVAGGEPNAAASFYARMSGNGQRVAYSTNATNMVATDTDATEDVYLIYVTPPNSAPVADAGADLEVPVGEPAGLNGINSSDDNDQYWQLTYQWMLVERPSGSATVVTGSGYTATLRPDMPGTYRVELRVTDSQASTSAPDEVEITAGLVPAYVFKKVRESPYTYSRNGDAYTSDTSYANLVEAGGGEATYLDTESSYDSTTRVSSYDYRVTRTDGQTNQSLLARGDVLNGSDTVENFYNVGATDDQEPVFKVTSSWLDSNGYKRYRYGLWQVAGAAPAKLLDLPVTYSESGTTAYIYGPTVAGDQIVGMAYTLPYSYKEYTYEYNGQTRIARYYDQSVYRIENGVARPIWGTKQVIPGLGVQPYYAWVAGVSPGGQIVVQFGTPAPTATCSGCFSYGLLLIGADDSVKVIARTDAAGNFPSSSFGRPVFGGEQLRVAINTNPWTASGIYRYDGTNLVRELGYYASTGVNTWSRTLNFDARGDDLYFGDGCDRLGMRVDGNLRGVRACGPGYPYVIDGAQVDWAYRPYTQSAGKSFDRSTLSLQGYRRNSYQYSSTTQYSADYTYFQFIGFVDSDRDGRIDREDNCPRRPNEGQEDADGDGIGDVCEDSDADGSPDVEDNCWAIPNAGQLNSDQDSFGDACDVCPLITDDQTDSDGDGIGDACDPDRDGDLVANEIDNCPDVANPVPQLDLDGDGAGDVCDADKDGDGITNGVDGQFAAGAFTDESALASFYFTDQHLGGTSFGRILANSGGNVTVEDAEDSSKGLLVTTTADARFKLCGDSGTTFVVGATVFPVTCSSLTIETRGGFVNHDVMGDGQMIVAIPQTAAVKIVEQSATETAILVEPYSASPVEVEIGDGIVATIAAAATVVIEQTAPEQYEVFNSTSSAGTVTVESEGRTIVYEPGDVGVPVRIDIKPDSTTNTINLGSNGVAPVAIFSSESFDATTIDPLSISLANAKVRLKGKGTPQMSTSDVDGDGRLDMVVHVETSAMSLSSSATSAQLRGITYGGVAIRGTDLVTIVQ